jgi:hypothetical protein
MSIVRKIKRAVRGEAAPKPVALEVVRRSRAAIRRWRDRATVEQRARHGARLQPQFAQLDSAKLLEHFQRRKEPHFLPGWSAPLSVLATLQRTLLPVETTELLAGAERIVSDHCWPLLGLGEKCFGAAIDWHLDPLSGVVWQLHYHADIQLSKGDGSDARMVWELNRLPHLITLARAYTVTNDERFSAEFFQQLESWRSQNPFGRGVNWSCAMEVALRAINLLGAFELFRHSQLLSEQYLSCLLATLGQHGAYILRNLEFSYLATSNHYLSDVAGLLWLGLMLPELNAAKKWRDFGLREMLREMDKQVLADGADFEASTGYHRFALELFLYSFILCRANGIEIEERYWQKLQAMLDYVRAYLRPDGRAPLVGDTDGGQALPITHRAGDDHAYLLALGAVIFKEPRFKYPPGSVPEELLWVLGEPGVRDYQELAPDARAAGSRGFPEAGTYVLREGDLYLLLNANGSGINGRGSHGHNDALSVEVSACGRPFIVDPGSYVYTADLRERHLFRSTAYHSTVGIDGVEQNTTDERAPFVLGDEAHPQVLLWETGSERDRLIAEHTGYARLPLPVTHRRTVTFRKSERWWLVEDERFGTGDHRLDMRFHFDVGLELSVHADSIARACDKMRGGRLLVCPLDLKQKPDFECQFTSRDYGSRGPSLTACWSITASVPCQFRWAIVPVCAAEDVGERLRVVHSLTPDRLDSLGG